MTKKTIQLAAYEQIDTVSLLTWKSELKNLDLIKSSNCLYVSSLNYKNLMIKLSKLDSCFKDFTYVKEDVLNTHKYRRISLIKT